MHQKTDLTLGIDIGTSSIKVALVEKATRSILCANSRNHNASFQSEIGPVGNEQDVSKILIALQMCVSGISKDILVRVRSIAVSGQMHGAVFWKRTEAWIRNDCGRFEASNVSQLFTWQDSRCDEDFIADLPKADSHQKIASGMGVATIFWLQKNNPEILEKYVVY